MNRQQKATQQILAHVRRTCLELDEFLKEGVNVEGVLLRPSLQVAKLKVAREEISKAITAMVRTKWPT